MLEKVSEQGELSPLQFESPGIFFRALLLLFARDKQGEFLSLRVAPMPEPTCSRVALGMKADVSGARTQGAAAEPPDARRKGVRIRACSRRRDSFTAAMPTCEERIGRVL